MDNNRWSIGHWRNDRCDKDNMEYYKNPQLRDDYEQEEMDKKATACTKLIKDQLQVFAKELAAIRNQNSGIPGPAGITLQVLSLGCGPGTDLLAVIRACLAIGGVARIDCVGVDLNRWPLRVFSAGAKKAIARDLEVRQSFVICDSASYVEACISAGRKFDLVISCYARARDMCPVFGQRVPRILSERGRVFVIDNNSKELRDGLSDWGFDEAGQWNDGRLIYFVYKKPTHAYMPGGNGAIGTTDFQRCLVGNPSSSENDASSLRSNDLHNETCQ